MLTRKTVKQVKTTLVVCCTFNPVCTVRLCGSIEMKEARSLLFDLIDTLEQVKSKHVQQVQPNAFVLTIKCEYIDNLLKQSDFISGLCTSLGDRMGYELIDSMALHSGGSSRLNEDLDRTSESLKTQEDAVTFFFQRLVDVETEEPLTAEEIMRASGMTVDGKKIADRYNFQLYCGPSCAFFDRCFATDQAALENGGHATILNKLVKALEGGKVPIFYTDFTHLRSALHWAVLWADELDKAGALLLRSTLLFLLDIGISPLLCDRYGERPVDIAERHAGARSIFQYVAEKQEEHLKGPVLSQKSLSGDRPTSPTSPTAEGEGTCRMDTIGDIVFETAFPQPVRQAQFSKTQPNVFYYTAEAKLYLWDMELQRPTPIHTFSSAAGAEASHYRFYIVPYHRLSHGHTMTEVILVNDGTIIGLDFTSPDPKIFRQSSDLRFDVIGGEGEGFCCHLMWTSELLSSFGTAKETENAKKDANSKAVVRQMKNQNLASLSAEIRELEEAEKKEKRASVVQEKGSESQKAMSTRKEIAIKEANQAVLDRQRSLRTVEESEKFSKKLLLFPYGPEGDSESANPDTQENNEASTEDEEVTAAVICVLHNSILHMLHIPSKAMSTYATAPLRDRIANLAVAIDAAVAWQDIPRQRTESEQYRLKRATGVLYCGRFSVHGRILSAAAASNGKILTVALPSGVLLTYNYMLRSFSRTQAPPMIVPFDSSSEEGSIDGPMEALAGSDAPVATSMISFKNSLFSVWSGKNLFVQGHRESETDQTTLDSSIPRLRFAITDAAKDSEVTTCCISPRDSNGIFFTRRGEMGRIDLDRGQIHMLYQLKLSATECRRRSQEGDNADDDRASGPQFILFNADGTFLMRFSPLYGVVSIYRAQSIEEKARKERTRLVHMNNLLAAPYLPRHECSLPKERLMGFLQRMTSWAGDGQRRADHTFFVVESLLAQTTNFSVNTPDADNRLPAHIVARSALKKDIASDTAVEYWKCLLGRGCSLYHCSKQFEFPFQDVVQSPISTETLMSYLIEQDCKLLEHVVSGSRSIEVKEGDAEKKSTEEEKSVVPLMRCGMVKDQCSQIQVTASGHIYFIHTQDRSLKVWVPQDNSASSHDLSAREDFQQQTFDVYPIQASRSSPLSYCVMATAETNVHLTPVEGSWMLPVGTDIVLVSDGNLLLVEFNVEAPHLPPTVRSMRTECPPIEGAPADIVPAGHVAMLCSPVYDKSPQLARGEGFVGHAATVGLVRTGRIVHDPNLGDYVPQTVSLHPLPNAVLCEASVDDPLLFLNAVKVAVEHSMLEPISFNLPPLGTCSDLRCCLYESMVIFTMLYAVQEKGSIAICVFDMLGHRLVSSSGWKIINFDMDGIKFGGMGTCELCVNAINKDNVEVMLAIGTEDLLVASCDLEKILPPDAVALAEGDESNEAHSTRSAEVTFHVRLLLPSGEDPVKEYIHASWVPASKPNTPLNLLFLYEGKLCVFHMEDGGLEVLGYVPLTTKEKEALIAVGDLDSERYAPSDALTFAGHAHFCRVVAVPQLKGAPPALRLIRFNTMHEELYVYEDWEDVQRAQAVGRYLRTLVVLPKEAREAALENSKNLREELSKLPSCIPSPLPIRTKLSKTYFSRQSTLHGSVASQLNQLDSLISAIRMGTAPPGQRDADGRSAFNIFADVIEELGQQDREKWFGALMDANCSPFLTDSFGRHGMDSTCIQNLAMDVIHMTYPSFALGKDDSSFVLSLDNSIQIAFSCTVPHILYVLRSDLSVWYLNLQTQFAGQLLSDTVVLNSILASDPSSSKEKVACVGLKCTASPPRSAAWKDVLGHREDAEEAADVLFFSHGAMAIVQSPSEGSVTFLATGGPHWYTNQSIAATTRSSKFSRLVPSPDHVGIDIVWSDPTEQRSSPTVPVCIMVRSVENGKVAITRLFPPKGIKAVYARHIPAMIAQSKPFHVSVPLLEDPLTETYMIKYCPKEILWCVGTGRGENAQLIFYDALSFVQQFVVKVSPGSYRIDPSALSHCAPVISGGGDLRLYCASSRSGLYGFSVNEGKSSLFLKGQTQFDFPSSVVKGTFPRLWDSSVPAVHPSLPLVLFVSDGNLCIYDHKAGSLFAVVELEACNSEAAVFSNQQQENPLHPLECGDQTLFFSPCGMFLTRVNLHTQSLVIYDFKQIQDKFLAAGRNVVYFNYPVSLLQRPSRSPPQAVALQRKGKVKEQMPWFLHRMELEDRSLDEQSVMFCNAVANSHVPWQCTDVNGKLCLHYLCLQYREETLASSLIVFAKKLRLLLDIGANVHLCDRDGTLPIDLLRSTEARKAFEETIYQFQSAHKTAFDPQKKTPEQRTQSINENEAKQEKVEEPIIEELQCTQQMNLSSKENRNNFFTLRSSNSQGLVLPFLMIPQEDQQQSPFSNLYTLRKKNDDGAKEAENKEENQEAEKKEEAQEPEKEKAQCCYQWGVVAENCSQSVLCNTVFPLRLVGAKGDYHHDILMTSEGLYFYAIDGSEKKKCEKGQLLEDTIEHVELVRRPVRVKDLHQLLLTSSEAKAKKDESSFFPIGAHASCAYDAAHEQLVMGFAHLNVEEITHSEEEAKDKGEDAPAEKKEKIYTLLIACYKWDMPNVFLQVEDTEGVCDCIQSALESSRVHLSVEVTHSQFQECFPSSSSSSDEPQERQLQINLKSFQITPACDAYVVFQQEGQDEQIFFVSAPQGEAECRTASIKSLGFASPRIAGPAARICTHSITACVTSVVERESFYVKVLSRVTVTPTPTSFSATANNDQPETEEEKDTKKTALETCDLIQIFASPLKEKDNHPTKRKPQHVSAQHTARVHYEYMEQDPSVQCIRDAGVYVVSPSCLTETPNKEPNTEGETAVNVFEAWIKEIARNGEVFWMLQGIDPHLYEARVLSPYVLAASSSTKNADAPAAKAAPTPETHSTIAYSKDNFMTSACGDGWCVYFSSPTPIEASSSSSSAEVNSAQQQQQSSNTSAKWTITTKKLSFLEEKEVGKFYMHRMQDSEGVTVNLA